MTRSYFGSIEYLAPDYYRVWWTTPDGKRHSHRMPNTTRAQAEAYLATKSLGGMPSTTTWEQFWYAKVAPQIATLSVKTQDDYERTWRVELQPRIGNEPVSDMDWDRANSVLTDIEAPTVQRSAGRLLKKMCNMAIRDKGHLLLVNPVDRAIEYKPHRPKRKKIVEIQEVKSFLKAIEGVRYEPLILCMLGFGMRPEEAYALLWSDIKSYAYMHAEYCAIEIDKALVWSANQGKVFKDTKNECSARTAVCGEPFASRLLTLAKDESSPLCPSGKPYDAKDKAAWYSSPVTITHNWKKWCERNGVDYIPLKNLRSSYSTMMGEAMVPDSVVQGNMGHSGSSVKERHYQTVTMRAKCMAAQMLADTIEEVSI